MKLATVTYRAGLLLAGVFLAAGALTAVAHDPGLSTGRIRVLSGQLQVELTLAQADVETLQPLDSDGDGHVGPAEWISAQPSLNQLAGEALEVQSDGQALSAAMAFARPAASNNVHFTATFSAGHTGALTIRSKLLGRLPQGHRQFVAVLDPNGGVRSETLLSAAKPTLTVKNDAPSAPEAASSHVPTFAGFLALGIEHIITGYDHLLFLFALLLMVPGFGQAAGIITSFTVAHSITLALATLDVVHLPPRLVEPLIAASIVYVGVENVVLGDRPRRRWLLTFAFGLVHGFGFAGVLRELGVGHGPTGVATPLLAFNLGVELGQVAIAAIALPLLWQARESFRFIRCVALPCSLAVVALGAWWLLERTVF